MPVKPPFLIAGLLVWAVWCWIAIALGVPLVERHLVLWPSFVALLLCLLPAVLAAIFIVLRTRPKSSESAQ